MNAESDMKSTKKHEFVLPVQKFAVTLQPIRHYALTFLTKSITNKKRNKQNDHRTSKRWREH